MLYGLHLIQAWLPGKWEAFPKIAFLFSVFCFLVTFSPSHFLNLACGLCCLSSEPPPSFPCSVPLHRVSGEVTRRALEGPGCICRDPPVVPRSHRYHASGSHTRPLASHTPNSHSTGSATLLLRLCLKLKLKAVLLPPSLSP